MDRCDMIRGWVRHTAIEGVFKQPTKNSEERVVIPIGFMLSSPTFTHEIKQM